MGNDSDRGLKGGRESETLIAPTEARLKRFFIIDCQVPSETFCLLLSTISPISLLISFATYENSQRRGRRREFLVSVFVWLRSVKPETKQGSSLLFYVHVLYRPQFLNSTKTNFHLRLFLPLLG